MGALHFQLLEQLSAGADGVRYLARSIEGGDRLRIDRLFAARQRPERWREIAPRLQLVASIHDPHILRVEQFVPDDDDPHLVTRLVEMTLASVWQGAASNRSQALAQLFGLATGLQEAHRLGLVHGHIAASRVLVSDDGRLLLDLCGVHTEADRASELDAAFEPHHQASPEADVAALAVLISLLLAGMPPDKSGDGWKSPAMGDESLEALVTSMLANDASERPSMKEVARALRRIGATSGTLLSAAGNDALAATFPDPNQDDLVGRRLGRFAVEQLVGTGGMGRVYRARDISNDEQVALKVLHLEWSSKGDGLRRFYREARVLAELDNPHIAQFVEVNEDGGRHYLAMEYLSGEDLETHVRREGPLSVDDALWVLHDLAIALADVHDLGVVHRDVKPANVILGKHAGRLQAKLCDFGIARAGQEREPDNVTRAGVAVGTPHYMAPEQCVGSTIDARADVYSLGVTLFMILTGRVPFDGPDARSIVLKHLDEPPPEIRKLRPDVGESVARALTRMLAKDPAQRFRNARELLEEVERIRRGSASDIEVHPRLPGKGSDSAIRLDFEWELASSPEELWPHVSNTERINRAIGLGAVDYERKRESGSVNTYGKVQLRGMALDWQEHPYEWVAPRRMGILREFAQGPFVWMISKVELVAMSRGTLLLHRLVVEPRGMMGRAAVELELRLNTRRNLGRVYRRIDDYLTGQQRRPVAGGGGTSVMDAAALLDPFEAPRKPSEPQRLRIERGRDALARHGVAGHVADALCDYLAAAPDAEVGRIRPRAFARRLRFDEREVLRACLRGVSEGLLLLLWDVICPRCQVPASVEQSLENLREHQHCEACDIGYDADFGRSVEVVFRVHPEVRDSEMGTYCIGGPGHTPHVLAQVRLAPGERFELELTLDEGQYYVSGKQLPSSYGFRVSPNGSLRAWELSLGTDPPASTKRVMAMGHQRVVLSNDHDVEIVARVERSSARDDAMTAAEVVTSRLFRELFPGENLEQGQLVSVNRVALLLVELSDAWRDDDEAAAFARLNELTLKVDEVVSERGGAVVKIHGDGILTAFHDTGAATEAALDLLVGVGDLPARLALHGGATMVTSINDRLDYFGRVVRQVASLLALGERGELVLGEPIYADPGAAVLLASTSASRRIVVGDGVVGQALRCDDAATAELEPTPVMS